MATALEAPLESRVGARPEAALELVQGEAEEGPLPEEFGDLRRAERPWELDRKLVALCRERGPLRAVLSRVAFRLVELRAWERLGYARLSDYAAECLGLSARWVRDLAAVGRGLHARPRLEHALASGTLGWTKVRLLARLPREEDEGAWIAYGREVTAEELSKRVRAVDLGSVEAGAAEEEGARSGLFEVRCSPEVRGKWHAARGAARRAAGRMLHPSEAAELIAAEVLSALPIDEAAEEEVCEGVGVSWREEAERIQESERSQDTEPAGEAARPGPSDRSVGKEPPRGEARPGISGNGTVSRPSGAVVGAETSETGRHVSGMPSVAGTAPLWPRRARALPRERTRPNGPTTPPQDGAGRTHRVEGALWPGGASALPGDGEETVWSVRTPGCRARLIRPPSRPSSRGSRRPTPSPSTSASVAPSAWSNASTPASGPSSPWPGDARCAGRFRT
jgi:hypothetical protein